MKVKFSAVTYEDVKEKRKDILNKFDTIEAFKELSIHYLFKRLPFLVLFFIYVLFIVDKCWLPVCTALFDYFSNSISAVKSGLISFFVSSGIIVISVLFVFKVLFSLVRKIFPRKTPLTDKEDLYKGFWRDSENIEAALAVMDEINKLNTEDIGFSEIIIEKDSDEIILFLKNSKCGITTKQKYSVSYDVMLKKLRESAELDFSCLDDEWKTLLQKYQIEEKVS